MALKHYNNTLMALKRYNYAAKGSPSTICAYFNRVSCIFISSFLHRPGQVQYLPVHSIATDPHLHGKGPPISARSPDASHGATLRSSDSAQLVSRVSFAWICTAR